MNKASQRNVRRDVKTVHIFMPSSEETKGLTEKKANLCEKSRKMTEKFLPIGDFCEKNFNDGAKFRKNEDFS